MNDSTLCKSLALGNGTIGKWRQEKQKPSLDAMIKISRYFDVSLDYLVFGKQGSSTSPDDSEWLLLIHQLPEKAQAQFRGELIGYIKAMADMQEELGEKKERLKT